MHRLWLWTVGLAIVVGSSSVAHSAVIITTRGEEIICEIVKETDTYLIVDHRGYRRYVLKSNIRTLNREAGEGYRFGPDPLRFIGFAGGYELYGNTHRPGFCGGRLTVGFPLTKNLLVEGNLYSGRSRIGARQRQADPSSGPLYWTGATLGALWQMAGRRVTPIFDAGIGYFFLDHTVDESEVQGWRDFFGREDLKYTEKMESGIAFTMGAGCVVRLNRRFSVVMRTGVLVIPTDFTQHWRYDNDGTPVMLESPHGLLIRMVQTHVGVQMNF